MSMQTACMFQSLLPSRIFSRAACAQHLVALWLVHACAALSVVLAIVSIGSPLRLSEVICG